MTLEEFVKNLCLVAPNKGEAKKSVSGGLIRVEATDNGQGHLILEGMATDDVMSIHQTLALPREYIKTIFPGAIREQLKVETFIGYYYPDSLKWWSEFQDPDPDQNYSLNFDVQFWSEHVYGSIFEGKFTENVGWVELNPERLRKFSLLSPRGSALRWDFVEWADQSIIRWTYGKDIVGVYAPLNIGAVDVAPWLA